MIRVLVAASAVLTACGRNVELGTNFDAALDAPQLDGNPFTSGAYTMSYLDPALQTCTGSLAGNEASFTTVTRASLGLVDGAVTFTTGGASALTIAGTPVESAINQSSIEIAPSTSNPPGLWDGFVSGDFSAGPASTQRSGTDIAVDSTTATLTSGIQGELNVLYLSLGGTGQCSVTFGIGFTHP